MKHLALIVIAGIFLYFLGAFAFSYLPTHPPKHDCPANHEIFITTNGVHLDLILRLDQIDPNFARELETPVHARYVSFGWGDKNFYIQTPEWSDLTLPVAFKALFLRSETAMHVNFYGQKQTRWHRICLCDCQINKLYLYIVNSFKRTAERSLKKLDFEGYTYLDSFFEAKGAFTLFNTCNVWVNKGLKSIDIKTSVWSPFDFGVLFHVKRMRNESCSN
jgi:uncharacterized protein (TIGR02117 family)